ncbi:hypothetical protein VTP01DRAFT_1107 [Rhizomucor pusillus]|uniref:uncharacterized protein n=1 Tax=Rhizomucor pusillus TaxID=4840 RepID=UPI00374377ED
MSNAAINFTLHEHSNAARRGCLRFLQKNKAIQTPACLTYTIRGSVPHLIPDNLTDQPIQAIQVSLEHFVEQKEPASFKYPHGLHKYLNLPDYLLFCDIRDPSKLAPVSSNTEKYVAVDTHGGVRRVTTDVWKQAMEAYKPDFCASMADSIKAEEDVKNKRIKKSVDRTLRWLDECLAKAKELNIPLFAPVVGFHNKEERIRSASQAAERDVDGFILNAFELSKNDATEHIKTSLEHLPKNKPIVAYGFSSPERILEGIALGIDLFDGSYAYKTTELGRAIIMKFGNDVNMKSHEKADKTINLWDPKMAHSFEPIDPNCGCYTCSTPHSKAYIHHLLNAHEMLGPLLLMSHNNYQLEKFMESARKSIESNNFQQDRDAFMERYKHEREVNGSVGHEDEIDFESLGTPVKKKRTIVL